MAIKGIKNIGPGALIAAAFIGPGTVTICTQTGAQFGFALLWALGLSIVATIVLQEMAARLGLIYGKGLADAVKHQIKAKWGRVAALLLIVSAIIIGNSAYEAGNISGGVLGIQTLLPDTTIDLGNFSLNYLPLLIGIVAFTVLFLGSYKVLERVLVALVLIMSLAFIITAVVTQPDWGAVLTGVFKPQVPEGSLLMIIGLIGTTVVPYNLFLHASLVKEKWHGAADLKHARRDTIISILVGGLVSMAIVICAAAIDSTSIKNGADLAQGLAPLFGDFSKYFLAIGLFAAGITSAITAPMAAAYVAKGCFGWQGDLKASNFRMVWIFILLIGVLFSSIGFKSIEVIKFAQIANGLLLPIIALFLFWVVNQKAVMQQHTNTLVQNILSLVIILITIGLCIRTFDKVFEGLF